MTEVQSPYMTRNEAAEWLRCSVKTIDRRMIAHGWRYDLDHGRVLIHREDVMGSVKSGQVKVGQMGIEGEGVVVCRA